MNIAEIFKLLSDTSRLRIINLLYHQNGMCVCELEYILGLSQPNLSKHLINMKKLKVVNDEKKGKYTIYSLNQNFLINFPFIKDLVEKEIIEYLPCKLDLIKLKEYEESDLSCDSLSSL